MRVLTGPRLPCGAQSFEQAMNDAGLLRPNPGVNRNPTPASRERDRVRATASEWFKSGGQDFSLVCDWADLPAEAVQDHAFEVLGTPAERHSRTLRRVVWRAPGKADAIFRVLVPG